MVVVCAGAAGCASSSAGNSAPHPALTTAPVHIVAETSKIIPAGTMAVSTPLPAGMTEHRFPYILNGQKGTISIALSDQVYADYTKKEDPAWDGHNARANSTYFLNYANDPDEEPYLSALAKAIQAQTSNKDDQARIAVSLVQHIPYKLPSHQYHYPYEVLYKNEGCCGEKSVLLSVLLRDLGFGSAVFYFLPEDHMVAGIKAAPPFDFRNSGYAFIEATEPFIITDSMTDSLAAYKYTSTMEITPVGTGIPLMTVANDAGDAKTWAALEAKGKTLSTADYAAWQALDTKYDLSYYT
jgi:hypothetical protein